MGNLRHGMYGTPTYKSWSEMKSRCDHPERSSGNYHGIRYCERWARFENFFADMGVRPDGTSLDRINPKGDYTPENCRWADIFTQENNRSDNVYYDFRGEKLTLPQIARKYGLSRSNLAMKIYHYKMTMEEAVSYLIARKEERTYRRA